MSIYLTRRPEHEFYQDLPSVLQSIQLELQSHGMDLLYHHHDFELEPYSDDENVAITYSEQLTV